MTTAAVKGSANARVVLIEYSDFGCPFCGRHAQTAFLDIQREFVESGLVRYVFRHLPLEQLHPSAKKAAEAAECAHEQGKFWEMHDRLFANQKSFTVDKLIDHASAEQLDLARFRSCLVGGQMATTVSEHVAEARRLGITGTPSFLIGEIQPDGTVHIIRKLAGAEPFQVFRTALNNLVTRPGAK
jgi:protein-disulfide isomerase